MLEDRAVDAAKEAFDVDLEFVLLRALPVVDAADLRPGVGVASPARATGRTRAIRIRLRLQLRELLTQCRLDRRRHAGRELEFFEGVAIAFEQTDALAVQREHLVAVRRLHDARTGLMW